MQLEIDGQNISYTLEQEKTIDEVLSSLSKWLSQYHMVAETLHIDAHPYEKAMHDHLPINGIKKIAIVTQHAQELQMKKLVLLREVIQALIKDIAEGKQEVMLVLQEEKESILEIVRSCFSGQEAEVLSHTLFTTPLIPVLQTLQEIIHGRIEELLHPEDISTLTEKNLRTTLQGMSDIPLLLQTGKTQGAMNLLTIFTQELQTMLRVNSTKIDTRLHPALKELQDRLADKVIDTVLLGDIIEYDVVPLCSEWLDTLKSHPHSLKTAGA